MCEDCKKSEQQIEKHCKERIVEIGTTKQGYTIFRSPNPDGGYDYISDSQGGGWKPVISGVTIEELELIIADMKAMKNNETKSVTKPHKDVHTEHCCKSCGCKYGEEDKGCSVTTGFAKQSYPCRGDCNGW